MKLVRLSLLFSLFTLALRVGSAVPTTPVILISVDTLRADHVGQQTPHINALAKGGTVFAQVNTPYPLTLPAHTALLTSTFPFSNGVQDNGIPLNVPATTLANILRKSGYKTGAFVGSFVLDRRFGLSQGFDMYDGPLDVHNNPAIAQEHKRPGNQVEEAAKHWLEGNGNAPFFLFLHLYDLHAPYSLPANPALRHGETGYQAELAYVDQVLGDFFAFLERRGLLQKSLIVFTSDHGEGLGEHGESSHGYFVYQSTLHVPLTFHWPAAGGKRVAKERVDEPASLLDVAPTILDALGISKPAEMRGHSLISNGQAEDVYSESIYARRHFGCASLRSVRAGNYKYIDAPAPELYDLASDPNEQHNLYDQQKAEAGALRERIGAVRASAPALSATKQGAPSADTAAALRSLGYLSGSSTTSRIEPRIDPKGRIKDFERYVQALALSAGGQAAESNALLEPLAERLPDVAEIKMTMGMNRLRLGQGAEAEREFKKVIEVDPANAAAHYELGFVFFHSRQRDDAIREFKAALALEPWYTRADEALAEIYLQNKDFSQARDHLDHLLAVDPGSYTAHFNLGILAAMDKDWDGAQRHLQAAVRADPGSAEAHNTLGGIYFERGELDTARGEFQSAIRLQSNYAEAHYRLGLVYQRQGKGLDAERELRLAQGAGK